MLAHMEITQMHSKKCRSLFQGKEQIGAGKTQRSVSLRGVNSPHC